MLAKSPVVRSISLILALTAGTMLSACGSDDGGRGGGGIGDAGKPGFVSEKYT